MIDRYSLIPILACVYAAIAFPLILTSCSLSDTICLMEARPESKIFWPAMAAIAILFAVQRQSRLHLAPHIVFLLGYLAFAGTSVLWAFKPELSFIRFAQQAMILTAIIVPASLAARTADMVRGLFFTFALAALLNIFFVFNRPPVDVQFATWGYPGYFAGKNYLGECAGIALLLSLYEMLHPGWRRALGIVVALMAVSLLFLSNSKTALALALLVPLLARLTLLVEMRTRVSVAIILWSIVLGYCIFSFLLGFGINRLSYMFYGDSTLTGRTIIWDFAESEIASRPLAGWGYQSFWLVGPDAPSVVDAPGWVKAMPNAHNGYYDTLLELGYIGFALLLLFITATVHAVGRVAVRDIRRAWLLLSVAVYIIITNGLESVWMRGFEMLWIVFVIIAAEIARYWRPFPPAPRAAGVGAPRRGRFAAWPRRPAVAANRVPAAPSTGAGGGQT